jgi:hypothetical protein
MGYVRLHDGDTGTDATPARRPVRVGLLAGLLAVYAFAATSLAVTPLRDPSPPRGFLLDDKLAQAQVSVRAPGLPERPCTWHPGDHLFSCAQDSYAFVGPYAGYANGRAVRCTWLHPQPGGATTILRWKDVALGNHVDARLALLDEVGPGAEVRVRLLATDQPIGTLTATESREPGTLDAAVPPGPARGELRLELTAADHAWRLACVDLLMSGVRTVAGRPAKAPEGPADD